MRSVGLDLGVRHIAYCEVADGKVVDRTTVRSLSELASRLGPKSTPARVAFEACREGWHIHDKLAEWGHDPRMLDTTRIRQIGVGHHRRKNDPIDAEAMAQAVDAGRLPEAHVLSPERRSLRAKLSVRGALVETRSQYVTTIRGLARSAGVLLPKCAPTNFVARLEKTKLDEPTRELIAPLVMLLRALEPELARVEQAFAEFAEKDPVLNLCATAPGVGLIVAATFVSVIDEAHRFKNAHAVSAYLGLVPSESTTGGPHKRRLGSITKQGNRMARAMLVQAAWSIMRLGDRDDPLRRWAEHLANTRGKRIAADRAEHAENAAHGVKVAARKQHHRANVLERAAKKLRRKEVTKNPSPPTRASRARSTSSEMSAM
jgi:transposase